MDLAGLRVFVVEDEALVLLTLEDMLADLGCEVVVAVQQIEEASRLALEAAVDGELERLESPLRIRVAPQQLCVLAPEERSNG